YLIPQEQHDPVAPVELLRRLAFNGIEVDQLDRSVEIEGFTWPAGTWVIRMDQPFANFVRQLFDIQEYPDLRQYEGGATRSTVRCGRLDPSNAIRHTCR
ncbi:hypothetical protein ACFL39_02390, partial [Gemmatimonadota bacterium]